MAALLLIWASQAAPLALAAPARSVSEPWREVDGHSGTRFGHWSSQRPYRRSQAAVTGTLAHSAQRSLNKRQRASHGRAAGGNHATILWCL